MFVNEIDERGGMRAQNLVSEDDKVVMIYGNGHKSNFDSHTFGDRQDD